MAPTLTTHPVPRPLRILHVVSGDLWAGAEAQVFELLRELQRRSDISVRAIVMNQGFLAERLASAGVPIDVLEERNFHIARLALKVGRIARIYRPDVIHTHRRKEHVLGGLAAVVSGAVAVATIHGRNEFSYPWWKLHRTFLFVLETIVLRCIHSRLIAVSAEIVQHLSGPANRVIVIPNSIDIEAVRSASAGPVELRQETGTKIAFLGRLVPVKRVDRIINALAELEATEPRRWSLYIIGDGPLKSALEAQAQAARLDSIVHFIGFTPNPLPWLARMDALVFASEHEGLPMTALEALALGVPVVSLAIGGIPDLLREAGLGTIASSADPRAIAAAIRSAVASFTNTWPLRVAAVPREYTIQRAADAYESVYDELARN